MKLDEDTAALIRERCPFDDPSEAHAEADEIVINLLKATDRPAARGWHNKMKVFSLVERRTGVARSYVLGTVTAAEIGPIVARNVNPESRFMTDDASVYKTIGKQFITHDVVNHTNGEYVRLGYIRQQPGRNPAVVST